MIENITPLILNYQAARKRDGIQRFGDCDVSAISRLPATVDYIAAADYQVIHVSHPLVPEPRLAHQRALPG